VVLSDFWNDCASKALEVASLPLAGLAIIARRAADCLNDLKVKAVPAAALAPLDPLCGPIEAEVRKKFEEMAVSLVPDLAFDYLVTLVAPSRVNVPIQNRVRGSTDARESPRKIALDISDVALENEDIYRIVYVLFHELVCHGTQSAGISASSANAADDCEWSEGWMDETAALLAIEWAAHAPHAPGWLNGAPGSAGTYIHQAQATRINGVGAQKALPHDRQAARNVRARLRSGFQTWYAVTHAEAELRVVKFTMTANALGDLPRLDLIGRLLEATVGMRDAVTDRRPFEACIEFLSDHQLSTLIERLTKARDHPP
jgi:hypothetical protein